MSVFACGNTFVKNDFRQNGVFPLILEVKHWGQVLQNFVLLLMKKTCTLTHNQRHSTHTHDNVLTRQVC
ncbi:hypothetical protein HOLleu_37332 [Holothuria leucospilota]|uniref:Uncharacterized protein n=1 Tax=Holothuria leucospilota TaxID=206669 RepID=A0A9Q0YH73_HOLLE|nr:hypothetical protein HOLleu_37332 [Holothuria leucospilota]